MKLKEILKNNLDESSRMEYNSNRKHWNTIANMVSKSNVIDIGRKKEKGELVHEFEIDNIVYQIKEL